MKDTVLETERLYIRQWRPTDLEPLVKINQDVTVMAFFPSVKSREDTEKFINANIKIYNKRGYCLYPIELKETNEFLGWVGLNYVEFDAPFAPAVEIGWRLASRFWGNGYATEAALAIRDHAINNLGIEELVSFTVPKNLRSIRVMKRLGFTHDPQDDFDHPEIPVGHDLRRHVLYRSKSKHKK